MTGLDITHMTDQAVWESFDLWGGPIMASHCVSRSVVPGQRHLTDDMIRREAIYGMEGLVPHIERIADLAGGVTDNVAIGTDMDGGFGAELTPTDVDTIADLQGFPAVLEEAGIAAGDIEGILHENALHFFRTAWSS